MRRPRSKIAHFAHHDGGSVAIAFGLATILLFAMIGAALDYGKWHNAYMHVETTLDRALLAGGRQLQTHPTEPQLALEAARRFFDEAVPRGVEVQNPYADFDITEKGMAIEGAVRGKVATPFLSLINIDNLAINTKQKVAFNVGGGSGSKLEVALMLDVTGSMCGNGEGPCTSSVKMDALKTAAKDLIRIVVIEGRDTRAAIVPFSTRVRIGKDSGGQTAALMKSLTGMQPTWSGWNSECDSSSGGGGSEGSGTWACSKWTPKERNNLKIMPCVSDRTGPQQFTDAAPGANAWLNAHAGNRFPLSWDSSDTPITSGLGKSAGDAAGQWNYTEDGNCADIMGENAIMPLTNVPDEIANRIDNLEAYGSTAGALGTAWAWYMLSPNWSNVWTGTSAPGPYADVSAVSSGGRPKLRKIAVLMTDGDYNTHRTDKDASPNMVSQNAKTLCANMKAQGIEIFTVGFELDQLPATNRAMAIDTLQACGTDVNHFYNSIDENQLKESFRDIALKLSELYVAK